MKQMGWLFSVIAACTVILAGCSGVKQAATTTAVPTIELNIAAAVSLKDVLIEAQKNYESKNHNVKLILNLGGSGSLQRQIEQGAPVDVFIPADSKYLDELGTNNLINKETRIDLARNTLVLVVPKSSSLKFNGFADLTQESVQRLAIGEPISVPAGRYGVQVLQRLGIQEKVKGKEIYAKDVRNVLAYVETENVDAGIVYNTDALTSNKVKVIATAPKDLHEPIIYSAAVLSGIKQQKAAEDFVAYLASDEGKEIFKKYGFSK